MKISLVLIVSLLFLVGCGGDPKNREYSDNSEFAVETLFAHNGCTVFRFYDYRKNRRAHYFTNCAGETRSGYTVHSGKNMHTEYESIPTRRE